MTTKLFGTSKKKRKDGVKQPQEVINTPTAVISAGEGLCKKLVVHQTNIMQQVEIITNSLEPDSTTKPTSYGAVVTELLLQLDCAVSTTQKCLTKDIFEKNPNLKSQLADSERVMYANVALLVKWADFAGRDPQYNMNREYIFFCVTAFKDALIDIVRLVADNVIGSTSSLPYNSLPSNRNRRASVNDALLNRITPLTLVGVSGNPNLLSTPGVPSRSHSVKPRGTVSRDSLTSDSSDSDVTINRRSGSVELVDGDSPPQLPSRPTPKLQTNEARYTTLPSYPQKTVENGVPSVSPRKHSSPSSDHPFIIPTIINGDVPGNAEKPPPIPIKKRKQLGTQPMTSPTHSRMIPNATPPSIPQRISIHRGDYDDLPPPIPTKRHGTPRGGTSPSITPHSLPSSFTPPSMTRDGPVLPIRIDSIPGLRNRLECIGTPPPKPPRNLQPHGSSEVFPQLIQHAPDGSNLLTLIDQYNKRIKSASAKDGEAPPIPIKKRTTMLMYNQLIKSNDYTFDDSMIPSLNIPDMTAPPPLPPKKRKKRPEPARKPETKRDTSPLVNGSPRHIAKGNSVGSLDELELSSDELDPTDDTVNYLEVDDVTPYLKFEQEDSGGYTLRGGPLDALIAYAASTSKSVNQYTEAFLSTYYTLITPDELISKLLYRLHHFYKEAQSCPTTEQFHSNTAVWQATTSLLARVLTNLRAPLIKEAKITLIELLHTLLTDGHLKFAQLIRKEVVEKLDQKIPEFIPLSVAMCSNSKSNRVITDFDPGEVAKQMTILDADYFYQVDISEMLYWAKEHNEEKCPKLTMFTMHFNSVSLWCQTRLLEKDLEWKKREKLMLFFISIMKALREYSNFNSYLAILSAIESANVSRLEWSDRIMKGLEEPRALIDSRGSFKNYRQAFAQTKPPCIPYIGLYLQDLTFLEEQPTRLEDGVSINFGKRWKQFKSVDHIRFAQTKQYLSDYQPDPNILGMFNNFKDHENNEELYKRSLEIKPSNRQKAATTQT